MTANTPAIKPCWSGPDIAEFRRSWYRGDPGLDIAHRLGRTLNAVYDLRRRLGLPSRHYHAPMAEHARIEVAIAEQIAELRRLDVMCGRVPRAA